MSDFEFMGYTEEQVMRWATSLEEMMDAQARISNKSSSDTSDPTPENLRTFFLALIAESVECLNRLNWKPWKEPLPLDHEEILEEGGDMTAFFLQTMVILCNVLHTKPVHILRAYLRKSEVNIDRFTGRIPGYVHTEGRAVLSSNIEAEKRSSSLDSQGPQVKS